MEDGIITFHSNYHAEKINDFKINPSVCCVFYSKEKKNTDQMFWSCKNKS